MLPTRAPPAKSIEIDPVDFLINFRKLVERKLEETKPARLFIDEPYCLVSWQWRRPSKSGH